MADPFDVAKLQLPEDSEIGALMERCPSIEPLIYRDEEILIKEGADDQDIFIVLKGSYVVEQKKSIEGQQRGAPLAVHSITPAEPSIIGEMASLGDGPRSATVRCSGAVHVLRLSPEHMDVLLQEFPSFSRMFAVQFAHRLREANEMLRGFRSQMDMAVSQVYKQPGETIVEAGEDADALYQLIDGTVLKEGRFGVDTLSVSQTSEDFLNARAFFVGGANEGSIRAKTNAILVRIDRSSKMAAIRNFPELIEDLLAETNRKH